MPIVLSTLYDRRYRSAIFDPTLSLALATVIEYSIVNLGDDRVRQDDDAAPVLCRAKQRLRLTETNCLSAK